MPTIRMSDVLDQSEVDALLAAVEGGQMQQEAPPTVFGRVGRHRVDVHVYDFKRPERVSKDQMRALEALHEGFGRNFGAALSGYLRTIVEVNVANIEQLTYSEFIHSLPNPTCFNLLKAEQLDGQLCLEISPLIIYPIIDRLLGGSNADLFIPQRPLTQIEQRLVQRITDRATHHLSEAWSNLTPVTFSVHDFESNPQRVSDLLALSVGDVITTDKDSTHDVLIQIEGKNKFLGQVGQYRGTRSIRITRRCQQLSDQPAVEPLGRGR